MGVYMVFPLGHCGPELHHWPDRPAEITGMIFVLGRRESAPCPCELCMRDRDEGGQGCLNGRYHIQGLFTTEEEALGAALDESWFIGPLPVNVALPEKTITWPGLYFPKFEEAERVAGPPDAGTAPYVMPAYTFAGTTT